MNRPRRVAVTAPPEPGGRAVPARPAPEAVLDPARAAHARRVRRAQLRRAGTTLACGTVLLLGLPVLLRYAPGLAQWRGTGLPLGWVAVAWLPYPLLAVLAWWHLRRAERAECTERPECAERTERADEPPAPGRPTTERRARSS